MGTGHGVVWAGWGKCVAMGHDQGRQRQSEGDGDPEVERDRERKRQR